MTEFVFANERNNVAQEILARLKTKIESVEIQYPSEESHRLAFVINGKPTYYLRFYPVRENYRSGNGPDSMHVQGDDSSMGRRTFKPLKSGGYNYNAMAEYVEKAHRGHVQWSEHYAQLGKARELAESFPEYRGVNLGVDVSISGNASPDYPLTLSVRIKDSGTPEQIRGIINTLISMGLIKEAPIAESN